MSDAAGEKTHEATDEKREQARKEGRFAKSRDLSAVVSTAGVLAAIFGSRVAFGRASDLLFERTLGDLSAFTRGDLTGVVQSVGAFVAVSAVPAAIAAAICGAAAGLAQSGGTVKLDVLSFDPARLNPIPHLQQLFAPSKAFLEVVMGLLRVLVVSYVVHRSLSIELPEVLTFSRLSPAVSTRELVLAVSHVVTHGLIALAGIAALDYAKSYFTLQRDMRMSRQEIMDESRGKDGDPKVKGRMRARARALARKRSLKNVKTATVIVANPTHVSVALRYTAADPAPIVVAKGHDEMALQIRAEARRRGIPILENRALARALDAEVQIGHPVPSAHFAAVARILAFVFRLRGGAPGIRRAP